MAYMRLTGATGTYASAPDSSALSILSDITIMCRVALTDWTPAAVSGLVGKRTATGNQISYYTSIGIAGAMNFQISPDGTAASVVQVSSSANPSVGDGDPIWLLASWRQSDGRVQFYTANGTLANPLASDFTQLGTDQSLVVASIFDSTALLEIGSTNTGTLQPASGNFFRAIIRNGVFSTAAYAGTIQLDADFNSLPSSGLTSFTESSTNAATVTLNGAAAISLRSTTGEPGNFGQYVTVGNGMSSSGAAK